MSGRAAVAREQRIDTDEGRTLASEHIQQALRHGRLVTRRAWAPSEAWVAMLGRNPYSAQPEHGEGRLMYSPPGGGMRPYKATVDDQRATDWVVLW